MITGMSPIEEIAGSNADCIGSCKAEHDHVPVWYHCLLHGVISIVTGGNCPFFPGKAGRSDVVEDGKIDNFVRDLKSGADICGTVDLFPVLLVVIKCQSVDLEALETDIIEKCGAVKTSGEDEDCPVRRGSRFMHGKCLEYL